MISQSPRVGGPLTLNESVHGLVRLLGPSFARAAMVTLAVLGPFQLAASWVLDRVTPDVEAVTAGEALPPEVVAAALSWTGATAILGLVLGVVVAGAVVAIVDGVNVGNHLTAPQALHTGAGRSGATLGATVLILVLALGTLAVGAVVVSPLVALVPPVGIALSVGLLAVVGVVAVALSYLAVPVAILGDAGALGTLRVTLRLGRRRLARLLGVVLLVSLVVVAATVVVSTALMIVRIAAGTGAWLVDALATTVLTVVAVPATASAAYVVYLDATARAAGDGPTSSSPG